MVPILIVRYSLPLQTQQHKFVNWQCDAEYRGDDFTAAVTLGNPDILVGSGTEPLLKHLCNYCHYGMMTPVAIAHFDFCVAFLQQILGQY